MLVAAEAIHALEVRGVGPAGHAGRHHELLGTKRDLLAVAFDDQDPLAGVGVVAGALRGGGPPVVELHHARVHLEPVGDLVLGREHRPVRRELHVRQVVVPHRIVQAQRLVAVAPRVTGPGVALDDDRRYAQLAQPRAEGDPALPAADDHHVRLDGAPQLLGLALTILEPRLPFGVRAVDDALRPPRPETLLVTLELIERGQERPGLAVDQPEVAAAATAFGLERDPGARDAVGDLGLLGGLPSTRLHMRQRAFEHVRDLGAALDGLDVPSEGDEVPPVALGREQLGRASGIAPLERFAEARKPLVDLGGRGRTSCGCGHRLSPRSGGGRTNSPRATLASSDLSV